MPSKHGNYLFMDIPLVIVHSIAIFFHFIFAEMKSAISAIKRPRRRGRKTFIYAVFCLCGFYIVSKLSVGPRYTFTNTDIFSDCIIPDLNPWDESIMQYDWHPDPIVCDSTPSVVFLDSEGKLQLNNTVVQQYHLNGLTCTYSEIHRAVNNDDDVVFKTESLLKRPTQINSDFVHAKCKDDTAKFQFDQILLQTSISNKKQDILPESQEHYSVLIFGVDAVSRLAAIRKLPKTYKYLMEELQAFEFKGHMKTGDNTFPNLVSILTGTEPFSMELPSAFGPFDNYPFIWNNFSHLSYATYFSEDSVEMQAFNLGKKGFQRQPTDHYMRPFWRAIKKRDLVSTLLDDALIGLEANKINVRTKSALCYDNTPKHMLTVQYFKDFIRKYSKKRRFALSWLNDLSHNYVNFLELGDKDFEEMLTWINNEGHFENSFLFFLSDHGSRIDAIRNTYVGRIEERMPLLLVVPPKSLKQKSLEAYTNMKENQAKLSSHYDIYKTLVDIMNNNIPSKVSSTTRGISLLARIPDIRSCADAGVPEQYCSCYSSKSISVELSVVKQLGSFVVDQINHLLKPEGNKCATLSLRAVKDAQEISLGLKHTGDVEFFSIWKYFREPEKEKELRYLILIQTSPGDGLFEATVKMDSLRQVTLLGVPSRTNKYGNQSACITDHIRRTFCLCNSK